QAEDGIRDFHVTGVQTCALPICSRGNAASRGITVPIVRRDGLSCQAPGRAPASVRYVSRSSHETAPYAPTVSLSAISPRRPIPISAPTACPTLAELHPSRAGKSTVALTTAYHGPGMMLPTCVATAATSPRPAASSSNPAHAAAPASAAIPDAERVAFAPAPNMKPKSGTAHHPESMVMSAITTASPRITSNDRMLIALTSAPGAPHRAVNSRQVRLQRPGSEGCPASPRATP